MLKLSNIISDCYPVAIPGPAVEVGGHHEQLSSLPESVRSMLLTC